MILTQISLQASPRDLRTGRACFWYEARWIGTYQSRNLRRLRYETDGFNKISITASNQENRTGVDSSSKVLCVHIPFSKDAFFNAEGIERIQMYADLYRQGIEAIDLSVDIPRTEMLGWIDEMEADDWRNEWVHRTRLIKELKVKCRMNCRVTMDAFELSVDIIKGKEVLLTRTVLTTKPDELYYHRLVDTADFHEDRIRILGKQGQVVAEIPVDDIPL